MKRRSIVGAAASIIALPTAFAQSGRKPLKSLRVATGPASGVYTKFFANIQNVASDLELIEVPTAGASANLPLLLKLGADIGFMQADFLWAMWKLEGEDAVYENIRTIMPLYDGAIHMVAVDQSIQRFSQLAGKRIGTFGGGAVTLRIMMAKSGLQAQVMNFSREERPEVAMMEALRLGRIDAAVGIGGAPVPWVATINTQKGIQIPGAHLVSYDRWDTVKDLAVGNEKGFYKLKTLDYDNMPGTAQSLSVISLIVSARNWGPNEEETRSIQALFRAITNNLQKLKDPRLGNHPAWISVSPMRDPTWPWYGHLKASK